MKAILELKRVNLQPTYTEGELYLNGSFFCYTIEDTVRDTDQDGTNEEKIYGLTAIPYGNYKMIVNMSNRFKKLMPLLLEVPGFEGVRIHSGNTEKDSLGCIIIGLQRTPGVVSSSRVAFDNLMAALSKYTEFELNIVGTKPLV